MDSLRLSVIVIGFNIERYLGICLESLAGQLSGRDELVFVNDGSTDGTLSAAEAFSGKFDNYIIIDQENKGIIGARKAGLRAARGEYVLFFDGDDRAGRDMVSSYIDFVESAPETYDIILSDHWEERPDGRILKRRCGSRYGVMNGDEYLVGILGGSLDHYIWNRLYRRDFLLKAGYMKYPEITIAEDLLANAVFGTFAPSVCYADMTNYYYRYNGESATRKEDAGIVDQQIHALRLIDYAVTRRCGDKYRDLLDFQYYLFAYGYLQTDHSHKFKRYLMHRCRNKIDRCLRAGTAGKRPFDLSVLYGTAMIYTYRFLPCFAGAANSMSRMLINALHKCRLLKSY